jgi:transcriptional regulator of aromatic amino acid metabolism
MDVAEVLKRLDDVEQLDLPAVALIMELSQSPPTPEQLTELHPEIERAVESLHKHSQKTKEIVKRCKRMQASPSKRPPVGF